MELCRLYLVSLAREHKLIGAKIHTDECVVKVLDYVEEDKMTQQWVLRVQKQDDGKVIVAEFSDTMRYEVETSTKLRPNYKRLKPKNI